MVVMMPEPMSMQTMVKNHSHNDVKNRQGKYRFVSKT